MSEEEFHPDDMVLCRRCTEYMDPEVCWCGDGPENHFYGGSCPGFVPMGCVCFYNDFGSLDNRLRRTERRMLYYWLDAA